MVICFGGAFPVQCSFVCKLGFPVPSYKRNQEIRRNSYFSILYFLGSMCLQLSFILINILWIRGDLVPFYLEIKKGRVPFISVDQFRLHSVLFVNKDAWKAVWVYKRCSFNQLSVGPGTYGCYPICEGNEGVMIIIIN